MLRKCKQMYWLGKGGSRPGDQNIGRVDFDESSYRDVGG